MSSAAHQMGDGENMTLRLLSRSRWLITSLSPANLILNGRKEARIESSTAFHSARTVGFSNFLLGKVQSNATPSSDLQFGNLCWMERRITPTRPYIIAGYWGFWLCHRGRHEHYIITAEYIIHYSHQQHWKKNTVHIWNDIRTPTR